MTLKSLLLIAGLGALGAVGRYGTGLAMHRWLGTGFAYGTLAVNVLGCFLLAFWMHVATKFTLISADFRHALAVGFLGAFTTFSTFGHETMQFAEDGDWQLAVGNVAANLVLGLAAVWGGLVVGRLLYGGA